MSLLLATEFWGSDAVRGWHVLYKIYSEYALFSYSHHEDKDLILLTCSALNVYTSIIMIHKGINKIHPSKYLNEPFENSLHPGLLT